MTLKEKLKLAGHYEQLDRLIEKLRLIRPEDEAITHQLGLGLYHLLKAKQAMEDKAQAKIRRPRKRAA